MKFRCTAKILFRFLSFAAIVCCAVLSCVKTTGRSGEGIKTIGVFIPGVVSGSPVYEMLAAGVAGAAEGNAEVTVIEGGYQQAEWETKITAMAASASYELIVSSNPSLPGIVSAVSEKFPAQHFLLLDGELSGNPRVFTLRYNQREQSYMAGFLAALAGEEALEKNPSGRRIVGLIAAQEYPVMNNVILPGYLEGARAVNAAYAVDFRIVGNWYDAGRAEELARDMIQGGVRVILPVSGGANEGAVQAAASTGAKIVWFDNNGYAIRPGTIIGSAVIRQELAAFNQVRRWLNGSLPFGTAETAGIAEGYVDFIQDDPLYGEAVSEYVRQEQAKLVEKLRSGELILE